MPCTADVHSVASSGNKNHLPVRGSVELFRFLYRVFGARHYLHFGELSGGLRVRRIDASRSMLWCWANRPSRERANLFFSSRSALRGTNRERKVHHTASRADGAVPATSQPTKNSHR